MDCDDVVVSQVNQENSHLMDGDTEKVIGILANICVIAGIIFLAVELHQNNRLLRAQARYSVRQYRWT